MPASAATHREFELTDRDFHFISDLVHARTGIVLAEHKRDMVYSRLARRLRQLRLPDFASYIEYLQSEDGEQELGPLVNAITTNLTSFFREKHHFKHLRDEVLRPLLHKPPVGKRVRIWSAGSSTGAEAYSIAMVVHDLFKSQRGWDIKILATDIDTSVLQHGAAGHYGAQEIEHIPAAYRHYYDNTSQGIRMKEPLRQLVHFRHLNLLEGWPMKGQFDVIFCRNVVIYFDKPTQRVLFERYDKQMHERGHLYIGHSENLFNVSDRFTLIGGTIYQKGKAA